MLAKVLTCAVVGLDGALVEVEADIGSGLPAVTVVGLPDAAVQESKERVRAAIKNAGCTFPMRRVTINLAPADLKKEGAFLPTGCPLWSGTTKCRPTILCYELPQSERTGRGRRYRTQGFASQASQ